MHKQSHQNTHPTFTYRKRRIFYSRREIPSHLRCHKERSVFVQSRRFEHRTLLSELRTVDARRAKLFDLLRQY
jgi:hypothetical protein